MPQLEMGPHGSHASRRANKAQQAAESQLRTWMEDPRVSLIEARDPGDEDTTAWRSKAKENNTSEIFMFSHATSCHDPVAI